MTRVEMESALIEFAAAHEAALAAPTKENLDRRDAGRANVLFVGRRLLKSKQQNIKLAAEKLRAKDPVAYALSGRLADALNEGE